MRVARSLTTPPWHLPAPAGRRRGAATQLHPQPRKVELAGSEQSRSTWHSHGLLVTITSTNYFTTAWQYLFPIKPGEMSGTALTMTSVSKHNLLASKPQTLQGMKVWALGKHEKPKGERQVHSPGPSLSFLVVISQERPEVEPIRVLGSPPADQHQVERPGQDFWLITRELNQSTLS